jgi:hypothetical protein
MSVCKETGPSYLTRTENLTLATPPRKYLYPREQAQLTGTGETREVVSPS